MKIVLSTKTAELRKKWLARYHEIEKKISKLRREWSLFEAEAHTSYQQWYHGTFAKTLSRIQEVSEEYQEYQRILSAVEAQMKVNGLNRGDAFRWVRTRMDLREDPYPSEVEYQRYRDEEAKKFAENFKKSYRAGIEEEIDQDLLQKARVVILESARRQYPHPPTNPIEIKMLNQAIEDAIQELYENMKYAKDLGLDPNDLDQYQKPSEEKINDASEEDALSYSFEEAEIQEESSFRIGAEEYKTTYRKIVRILHPDRGTEMNPEEVRLWGEAQRAYQNKDAGALKTILMRIETGGSIQLHLVESIGEIMNIVRALQDEWSEMNFQKNKIKKDPIYRFWASENRPKNRNILKQEIEGSLKHQLYVMQEELRYLQNEFDQLKRRVEKSGRTKLRKGR